MNIYEFEQPFYPFQLITHQFLHANLAHIFFNMFMLFSFGPAIEYRMGSVKFIGFYLLCGIGAGMAEELTWNFDSVIQELNRLADVTCQTEALKRQANSLNSKIWCSAAGLQQSAHRVLLWVSLRPLPYSTPM